MQDLDETTRCRSDFAGNEPIELANLQAWHFPTVEARLETRIGSAGPVVVPIWAVVDHPTDPAFEDAMQAALDGFMARAGEEAPLGQQAVIVVTLEMAVSRRLPGAGLVAHSDRGSQYGSEHYRRVLAGHRIACSMNWRANCWDNAPMESFFASMKKEMVHDEDYRTRAEAGASLFEYIEVFYSRIRRHSSLGYRSPAEYERAG